MKYMMKQLKTSQVAMVAMVLPLLATASAGLAAAAADTWGVEESVLVEKVDFGLSGRAVTVTFSQLADDRTPRTATDILVGGSGLENPFRGDLLTPGYSGLRFRVAGDGSQPQGVDVMIYRRDKYGSGRTWVHEGVEFSPVPGEWTVIRIPLDPRQGWKPSVVVGSRYTLEETWAQDLVAVDDIFVRITRAGLEPQVFSLADFQLVGSGDGAITEPARLSLIEDFFGVSNFEDIDKTLDSNGDGVSDYDSLRAGLDPRGPNSVFVAEAGLSTEGNTISWPGVLYGNYVIMRATDLRQGFVPVGTKQAPFTGTQTWTDTSPVDGAPNFYKVVKQ